MKNTKTIVESAVKEGIRQFFKDLFGKDEPVEDKPYTPSKPATSKPAATTSAEPPNVDSAEIRKIINDINRSPSSFGMLTRKLNNTQKQYVIGELDPQVRNQISASARASMGTQPDQNRFTPHSTAGAGRVHGIGRHASQERGRGLPENKKGTNNMTLTQDRLKQIIKEELEAIMNEVEEVSPEDAAVASLEKQLAEAKAKATKAKMKKGQTVGKRGTDPNTYKMNKVSPKINANAGKTGKVKK